ncbi:MAG: efflux RND transporter permease subunit, partial [Phycisphaerales bacterium]
MPRARVRRGSMGCAISRSRRLRGSWCRLAHWPSASKLASIRRTLLGDGTLLGAFGSSFGLALVVVFLLIAILFQSFRLPIVIMLAVPLATVGGFAALFGVFLWSATDPYMPLQTLDILTMLGFVLLIG